MKKFFYLSLIISLFCLASCNKDDTLPWIEKNTGWKKYNNGHYTSESNQFLWSYYTGRFMTEVDKQPISQGEFVELYNLTDSCITIKYGKEGERSYINLKEYSNNQIDKIILCPYSKFGIDSSIDTKLNFCYDNQSLVCYFAGQSSDNFGYYYKFWGHIYNNIVIFKELGYECPLPLLRKMREEENCKYLRDWRCQSYLFDYKNLKCLESPVIANWSSSAWNKEFAEIIPNLSDFLQLLMASPIFKSKEFKINININDEYMSMIDILCVLFTGVYQYADPEKDIYGSPVSTKSVSPICYYFSGEDVIVSKVNNERLCVRLDPVSILSNYKINPKEMTNFVCSIISSLLSEQSCHFEMNYELIDCDFNDKSKEREFHMILSDPQHSRNIMEYVILPLLIENRQAIKDYIRQDAELSQHADVLCAAVDRLEDIYAGTTDLTLGYRLIENQWD